MKTCHFLGDKVTERGAKHKHNAFPVRLTRSAHGHRQTRKWIRHFNYWEIFAIVVAVYSGIIPGKIKHTSNSVCVSNLLLDSASGFTLPVKTAVIVHVYFRSWLDFTAFFLRFDAVVASSDLLFVFLSVVLEGD